MESKTRVALLIDADNAPAAKIDFILSQLSTFGETSIRRAYGNWKKNELKGWEDALHEHAIRPMQQYDYSRGKNASDMALVIDAMALLYTDRPDAYGLVSSDADFTPLVMHLREKGAAVYGFGAQKTPAPFVNACSRFLYLENLGQPVAAEEPRAAKAAKSKPAPKGSSSGSNGETAPTRLDTAALKQDARLVALLRNAVESAAGEDGWSALGRVGQQIGNQASFDPRNYGYRKLIDLIEATQLFEVEKRETHLYLRDRRLAKAGSA